MTLVEQTTIARKRHPAPFPQYILDEFALILTAQRRHVGRALRILDPFAGIGRVHNLPDRLGETVGVEIEPEWAACRAGTIVGDATQLPDEWTSSFDAVVTSPCYGNRLADHHEARDSCPKCDGIGVTWTPEGCGDAPMICPDCSSIGCACGGIGKAMRRHVLNCGRCRSRKCGSCHGTGLSFRHTYRHVLGRMPDERSAGAMQWGAAYRDLHESAWREARRVVRADGLMLVNMKNHIRHDVEQYVVEWHEITLNRVGFDVLDVRYVSAPGIRHGSNYSKRVDFESIICARPR